MFRLLLTAHKACVVVTEFIRPSGSVRNRSENSAVCTGSSIAFRWEGFFQLLLFAFAFGCGCIVVHLGALHVTSNRFLLRCARLECIGRPGLLLRAARGAASATGPSNIHIPGPLIAKPFLVLIVVASRLALIVLFLVHVGHQAANRVIVAGVIHA